MRRLLALSLMPHPAKLVFLVGGSAEALAAARPVFSVLGRDVVHLGPVGSGALMKLVNNFVCGVQAASFAEAMSMVDAGGLDRAKAVFILTGSAPGSGIVKCLRGRKTFATRRAEVPEYRPYAMVKWIR
jgi:3-hydroxyisobutyrate dehydrogenase